MVDAAEAQPSLSRPPQQLGAQGLLAPGEDPSLAHRAYPATRSTQWTPTQTQPFKSRDCGRRVLAPGAVNGSKKETPPSLFWWSGVCPDPEAEDGP